MERDVTKLFETQLIYPCSKFNYDQVVTIRSVKDGEVYLRGAALLNEKKPVSITFKQIAARRSLSCTLSTMETKYYSTKTIRLPQVCYHRGCKNQLLGINTIKELKTRLAKVRSACFICFIAGKEPAKCESNNNPKEEKI